MRDEHTLYILRFLQQFVYPMRHILLAIIFISREKNKVQKEHI